MNSKNLFQLFKLFSKHNAFLIASFLALILSGCGGGSSSKAATENNLPSPVAGEIDGGVLVPNPTGQSPVPPSTVGTLPQVSVGPRQYADPNVLLNLRGSVVPVSGSQIVKTLWTQVTGPQVIIPSPESLDNIILVPDVNLATQLEFRLTAQDSEGRVNSATLFILVKPVPTFVKVIGGVFNEADKKTIFKIRLNAPSTNAVNVSYSTQDGTANSGSRDEGLDFIATSGDVSFAPGEVLKEIAVEVFDDPVDEADETLSLQVTAIDGSATHANTGVAIIRNSVNSQPPQQLPQEVGFETKGPVNIYLNEEYNNVLSPAGLGTGDIIFSSSDTSIAYVSSQGVVSGVGLGTATITATKLADDNYLSANTSYTINVLSRGTPPVVNISAPNERQTADGYSVLQGETVDLRGFASDEEDGDLPTQAQIAENEKTGEPITSLRWTSDLDGFLGYGDTLDTNELRQGTHAISYSVTDSDGNTSTKVVRILVGNVAPKAAVSASSTYCPNQNVALDCYYPFRVNDTNLSTELGGLTSWVNENPRIVPLPQYVELDWKYAVTIDRVDIYTTEGYIIRDYDIEYGNGDGWSTLLSVQDNTEVHRSDLVSTVTTYQLRVVAKEGSLVQPQHARINEIVVFGTMEIGAQVR